MLMLSEIPRKVSVSPENGGENARVGQPWSANSAKRLEAAWCQTPW